jgi:hypothetical protein
MIAVSLLAILAHPASLFAQLPRHIFHNFELAVSKVPLADNWFWVEEELL